eukprot:GEMP01019726.1.p1 GENE.GEMP01019726.1~~GEMP01019726.1.p1  ORF type:complete len:640 (+),score=128.57 GEMP01019726.1:254-2173(+)
MLHFVALVSWYHGVRADLPVACTLSLIEGQKWQFNVCNTSYADAAELHDCGQYCAVNESDEEKIEITLFRMMSPNAPLDRPDVQRHWKQSVDDAYYRPDAQRDLAYRIQGSNVSGEGEWTPIYNEAISVTLFPPNDQGPRRTFIAHMFYKTTSVDASEPIDVLRSNSDCSFTQVGWHFGDISSKTARAKQFGCFYAGVMGKSLTGGRNFAVSENSNSRAAQRTRGLFHDQAFREAVFLQRPVTSGEEERGSQGPQRAARREERSGHEDDHRLKTDMVGMPVRRISLRNGNQHDAAFGLGRTRDTWGKEAADGRAILPGESARNPRSGEEPKADEEEDPLIRVSMAEETDSRDPRMMLDLATMSDLAAKINSGNYGWHAKVYPEFVRPMATTFSLKFRQHLHSASERLSNSAKKRTDTGVIRTPRGDGPKKTITSASFCRDKTFPRGPTSGKELPETCSWAKLTGEAVEQGACGSCYAVSSVNMLQSRYFKRILEKEFPDVGKKHTCDSMLDNQQVKDRFLELWNSHRLDHKDIIKNDGMNSPMNEACDGGFPFLVLSWYKYTGGKVPFMENQSRQSPSYAPPTVIDVRYLGAHGFAPETTATCSHERRMMQRLVEHGPLRSVCYGMAACRLLPSCIRAG